jgi:hypothetical protein
LLQLGPLVSGSHDFDEHCMFGNDMYLTKGQVNFLNEHCNHFPTEEFQYYVYRMTKSAVINNKCKLVKIQNLTFITVEYYKNAITVADWN